MDKRTFLKAVGATLVIPVLPMPAQSRTTYEFSFDAAISSDGTVGYYLMDNEGTLHLKGELNEIPIMLRQNNSGIWEQWAIKVEGERADNRVKENQNEER